MSFRYEKTAAGNRDLIIDGFEKGIAVSPYLGIGNIRNLNTSYYPGVAYSNYRRQAATITANTTPVAIDSYSESNFSNTFPLYAGGTQQYVGQLFYNNHTINFNQAKFYLSKTGSPTGTMTAGLYSVTSVTPASINVSVLVVAGGGGGGAAGGAPGQGGGGGGGAVRTNTSLSITSQAYTVTVGTGGASGASGLDSVFNGITSTGGGHGGAFQAVGTNGGSGGGGGADDTTGHAGGTGTTGGNNGGASVSSAGDGTKRNAGGGGGAGAVGQNGSTATGGNGGVGLNNSLSGSSVMYGSGGGGAGYTTAGTASSGAGAGSNTDSAGASGTANRGGGGGGDGIGGGGSGGSGIVIISATIGLVLSATGGTHTTSGGNDIWTFTSSGTWTPTLAQTRFPLTNLVSSTAISVSTLTGSPALTTFSFASTSLTATTYYFIILSYTGGDVSNAVNVGYGITNEYSPFNSVYSTDGTNWSTNNSPTTNNLIYYTQSLFSSIGIPIQSATSPAGLNYILDNNGNIWKQSAVNSSTFAIIGSGTGRVVQGNGGLAYWDNYLVVIGAGVIEFCGDGTGDAGIISTNWNINSANSGILLNSQIFITNFAGQPTVIIVANTPSTKPKFQLNDPIKFTTTGTLPAPLVVGTTYYILAYISGGFTISATVGGSAITITNDGSGVHTVTDNAYPLPLGNCTKFDANFGSSVPGNKTLTINSYIDPVGRTVTGSWLQASGVYNIIMEDGQSMPALFTSGSPNVSLQYPMVYFASGSDWQIQLLNPSVTNYKAYISKVDGNLYFANGNSLGQLLTIDGVGGGGASGKTQNNNIAFNPGLASTYFADFGVTQLPGSLDSIVDMIDLKNTLVLAGNKDTYTWDYISANSTAPSPVGEQIVTITNILSNIYILAGQKGNIYVSNGYSNQLLYKMPDFIAGIIDPIWTFGGLMVHRSKLFFQALVTSSSATKILSGIFSLNVSSTFLQQESASGMVMEAQNSFGLVPAASVANGLLIDNSPSANGNDSYYSVWGSGTSSTGGIDYNDTSLWQNFEPVIETDMIPTGTNLENMTFGQVEYKVDRPLATGDQIRLSFRTTLTDSYTVIGTSTSTTATLSEKFNSDIRASQWVQFKVEFACASSSSSFIPLRELRLHLA